MNDTLQALNQIVRVLDESQNPTWLLYLSALGPLILTAISVFIACRQHRQNQNLQKQIADRDYKNILGKMHWQYIMISSMDCGSCIKQSVMLQKFSLFQNLWICGQKNFRRPMNK